MRNEQDVNRAIEQYSNLVRRLCMIHLKNYADTEDIFQTVFLKYALSSVSFENKEHEKSRFIRVTINACKDLLKSFFHSRTTSLNQVMEQAAYLPPDHREVLEAVLSPQKVQRYRIPVLLRGIYRSRNQQYFGKKCEYGVHAPDAIQKSAPQKAWR